MKLAMSYFYNWVLDDGMWSRSVVCGRKIELLFLSSSVAFADIAPLLSPQDAARSDEQSQLSDFFPHIQRWIPLTN